VFVFIFTIVCDFYTYLIFIHLAELILSCDQFWSYTFIVDPILAQLFNITMLHLQFYSRCIFLNAIVRRTVIKHRDVEQLCDSSIRLCNLSKSPEYRFDYGTAFRQYEPRIVFSPVLVLWACNGFSTIRGSYLQESIPPFANCRSQFKLQFRLLQFIWNVHFIRTLYIHTCLMHFNLKTLSHDRW
jgi:hypothetical protein